VRLPENGRYFLSIEDAQRHGGWEYGYRLRVGPPQPDFALVVAPSAVNVAAGRIAPIDVRVIRRDGFDGPVKVSLEGAPEGFELSGGRVPAGRDRVVATLTAPRPWRNRVASIRIEGRASIDGHSVARSGVPADERTQAFVNRHLVPARELLVAVTGPGSRIPPFEILSRTPARIPAKGAAEVRIRAPRPQNIEDVRIEIREPAEGFVVRKVRTVNKGVAVAIGVDRDAPKPDATGNLILEAFLETAPTEADGKKTAAKRRVSLGLFPAIPYRIVGGRK
jgi:hypothetical protein